jgi:hypothetical protein
MGSKPLAHRPRSVQDAKLAETLSKLEPPAVEADGSGFGDGTDWDQYPPTTGNEPPIGETDGDGF